VPTQAEIDKLRWFHAIDLGELQTPGRIPPSQPPNFSLFGIYRFLEHIDVTGADVIDVGTMDGLMAFAMRKLGAKRVVATDLWDRHQFRLAREALGYADDVEYYTELDVRDMEARFGRYAFDLMVFAGVLYHLMSPLEYLVKCRQLLKPQGLFLMETCFGAKLDGMQIVFNQGMRDPHYDEPTTYFLPSKQALLALLRSAGFDVLGVLALETGSERVTVLARAVKPSEVRGKTKLQLRHDEYCDKPNHFAYGDVFYDLEHTEVAPSKLRYAGRDGVDSTIDIRKFRPTVPFQPRWSPRKRAKK